MSAQVLNGESTFLDQNGDPLAGGFVYMYAPNTSNFQNTWQDPALSIFNTNPIVLDQAGRAKIWGNTIYRQVVQDQFGNVQWDLETQAGVTGSIIGDVTTTGNFTVGNNLQVNGTSNFAGLATFTDIHTADFTSSQSATFNFLQGTQGYFTHLQWGNGLGNDVNTNTLTVNSSANINSLTVANVTQLDGPLNVHSNLEMQGGYSIIIDSSGVLQTDFIQSVTTGSPVGTILCSSNFNPATHHVGNLGANTQAWQNVYAGNYITVSTSADSAEMSEDALEVVKSVPVKTEPHLGIAKEDLKGHDWSQVEINDGVNYNIVVGMLWKALQELNEKFDSYVEAHP